MWQQTFFGWQCCEGFGRRFAFPDAHPDETIGIQGETFVINAGSRRVVPVAVLAWLLQPFASLELPDGTTLRTAPEDPDENYVAPSPKH